MTPKTLGLIKTGQGLGGDQSTACITIYRYSMKYNFNRLILNSRHQILPLIAETSRWT